MDSNIGKKIDGRYEISELIGGGFFSSVFKGVDLFDDNKAVAIKIIDKIFYPAPSKAIAKLSHPNIVKTYDVVFSEEKYIVMEYVNGITLKDYINEKKVLKWKDTVCFVIQILRALQYAHNKRIVHLGIKPENIMMLIDGTIKVMDFHRELLDSFADVKRDIYSVGAMMYEMLTGKNPPKNDILEILTGKNPPKNDIPEILSNDIPDGLKKIVIRAMEEDPKDRYQTIADMLADMEKFNEDSIFVNYIQLEICMIALKKYTDAFNKSLDTVNMFNYKSIIERARKYFDDISEELSMSHRKLEKLRYGINKFEKRYSDNVHTIEILKREIKECDNLHKKYDDLLERFIYLSKEYTNLNEEYDALNIECDNLRKENDNLNKEHDALNIECDNLHNECNALKNELVKKELEKHGTIKIKTFYKLNEHEKANIYDREIGKYIKMLFNKNCDTK